MSQNVMAHEAIIQDFIAITEEVFTTMASLEIKSTSVREIDGNAHGLDVTACMDVTGVLGFSGGRKGSVLITFHEGTALKGVGGMLGMEFEELDADVRDGIGELVNMVAGGAKTKLQERGIDFELSIPNTVMGSTHQITAPAATTRTRLDFSSSAGDFFIEVYLKDEE